MCYLFFVLFFIGLWVSGLLTRKWRLSVCLKILVKLILNVINFAKLIGVKIDFEVM